MDWVSLTVGLLPTWDPPHIRSCAAAAAPLISGGLRGAAQAGVNVTYSLVRLPTSIASSSDSALKVLYALDTLRGFDCVLSVLSLNPGRQSYMNLVPVQSFGYQVASPPRHLSAAGGAAGRGHSVRGSRCRGRARQVVTTRPVVLPQTFNQRAWQWAQPFSNSVWLTYAGSIIISSLVMYVFEVNRGEDFDTDRIGPHPRSMNFAVLLSARLSVRPPVRLPAATSAVLSLAAPAQGPSLSGLGTRSTWPAWAQCSRRVLPSITICQYALATCDGPRFWHTPRTVCMRDT